MVPGTYVNNIINQPLEGEFTIQRTLINEDALLNMTGDSLAFSGVVTYKNVSGTATPRTDFKIYFTCVNGSSWTEVNEVNTARRFI